MAKGNGRANANNHSNQMNPNNAVYWSSRGPSMATPGAAAPEPKAPVAPTPPAARTKE